MNRETITSILRRSLLLGSAILLSACGDQQQPVQGFNDPRAMTAVADVVVGIGEITRPEKVGYAAILGIDLLDLRAQFVNHREIEDILGTQRSS